MPMRRSLSQLVDSLNRIRDIASDMDSRVLSSTNAIRLRDETLRCSCTVILSGFLESFIKECAEAYITEISSRRVPFSDLPKPTQRCHFVEGGQLLGLKTREESRVAWISADHLDMVRRLSSPALSPASYSLLWEAFAITQGNPGPDVIDRILKDLGVESRGSRLDAVLGGGYSTVKLAMQSFIAVRNECAHTGTALTVPTTVDLSSYCDLIERIARAFVSVLETRLGEAPFGVNLNTASPLELGRIPRLGSNRITALITHRVAHGPFLSVEDIAHVRGFGPALAELVRIHVHI
jgi:DNA uptake protein ComE-like DNA-binding protein